MWFFRAPAPSEVLRRAHSRYISVALLVVAVLASSWWGVLAPLDGLLYDALVRLTTHTSDMPSAVLLVEVDDPGVRGSATKTKELVRKLSKHGARSIGLLYWPQDAGRDFLDELDEFGRVAIGIDGPGNAGRDDLPWTLDQLPREFGALHVSLDRDGVTRRQTREILLEDVRIRTLASAVAEGLESEPPRLRDGEFLVRFRGGPRSLPLVRASAILEGKLVDSVVAGNVVLVGCARSESARGIVTPLAVGGETMSPLEYHGHETNTLLCGLTIGRVGYAWGFVLLLTTALGSWIVQQWSTVRVSVFFTFAASLLLVGAAYHALSSTSTWIPLAELLLVLAGVFVYSLKTKATIATHGMSRLLSRCSERLRDRHFPSSFARANDHWALVARMVNQTLDLTRAVFLETSKGDRMVREVASIHCSLTDIGERRRDMTRDPYLTALDSGKATPVEQFLTRSFQQEEQFIVPLVINEECLGFWVFGVDPNRRSAIPGFDSLVQSYAGLISELLLGRRRASVDQSDRYSLRSIVSLGQVESTYRELDSTTSLLGKKLGHTEALLNGINTSAIVYDLFGRVVHSNRAMRDLLAGEKLEWSRMSALDLVAAVSEYDLSRSRRLLRHVMVEQQVISLPVTLGRNSDSRYLLHLRPLDLGDLDTSDADASSFGAKCILLELVDTSSFAGLFEMKEKLTKRLGLHLRNDMASIELAASLLSSDDLPQGQRAHLSEIVHEKVAAMMDVLVECQQYLTVEGSAQHVERFPVDYLEYLNLVVAELTPQIAHRGLSIHVRHPEVMTYVLASTGNIATVFSSIIKVLLSDALDDSEIDISIVEDEDVVRFECRNLGFGIPNERFQEYLFGDKGIVSEELKVLRGVIAWVDAWGGALEASSEVGKGTRVELRLVKFM